jgi:hypothetical protein
MGAVAVQVRRVNPLLQREWNGWSARAGESELAADLRRARAVAKLLDSQFSIAGFKFGLDPIVDLVPIAGDAIMFAAGLYPVHLARKHKLGRKVEARMLFNLSIDFLTGLIPGVGAVADAFYKANLKNVALLEKAAAR